jgi:hypothetical protein
LLRWRSIASVIDAANGLRLASFAPFTLIVVQSGMTLSLTSLDARPRWRRFAARRPYLFTSSSLGDARVIGPRRRLFKRMIARSRSSLTAQRAFHQHAWPARPDISVLMSRDDAATVSRTIVDIDSNAVSMAYAPLVR